MTQRVGVVAREVGSLLQAENRVGVVRRTPELAGSPPEAPAGGELFLAFSTVFTRFCFHCLILHNYWHFFIVSSAGDGANGGSLAIEDSITPAMVALGVASMRRTPCAWPTISASLGYSCRCDCE